MRKKVKGSITVFLCLLLAGILAFVGTMADVARLKAARTAVERTLQIALEAEYTKYNKELYEDYHIFLLQQNKDINSFDEEEFLQSIQDYVEHSFSPEEDLDITERIPIRTADIMDLELQDCSVERVIHFTDYDGQLFEKQAVEYMKYKTGANLIEKFKKQQEQEKQTKHTIKVAQKKMDVEEKAAKIDEKILELITLVEGIKFDDGMLEMNGRNKIKVADSYAKQFCVKNITEHNVGINKDIVWRSVKTHYINPKSKIESWISDLDDMIQISNAYKQKKQELEAKQQEIATWEDDHGITEELAKEEPDEVWIQEQKETEEYVQLQDELETLQEAYTQLEEEAEETIDNDKIEDIYDGIESLSGTAEAIHTNTEDAIDKIDDIKEAQNGVREDVDSFGDYLESERSKIAVESYQSMKEDQRKLKNYVHHIDPNTGMDTSVVGHAITMKTQLEANKAILEAMNPLSEVHREHDLDSLQTLKETLEAADHKLDNYVISNLKFDYSQLQIPEEESGGSIFGVIGDLIEGGTLNMVVDDTNTVSHKTLTGATVSERCGVHDNLFGQQVGETLTDAISEGDTDAMSEGLSEYDTTEEQCIGDKLVNRLLINQYASEHFDEYHAKEEGGETRQNTSEEENQNVLDYEMEYIVAGNKSDYDNLKSLVMKIVFCRTITNYVALLCYPEAQEKATAGATLTVGFLCFAPLISLTKHLILIAWAYEESLVDVRALLDGKSVPVLTLGPQFKVRYEELTTMNREKIKQKANSISSENTGLISMNWDAYMQMFLFMKERKTIRYRIMDLIEKNMQHRYNPDFDLCKGVFGVQVKMKSYIPEKFISMPLINRVVGYDGEGCQMTIQKEHSY